MHDCQTGMKAMEGVARRGNKRAKTNNVTTTRTQSKIFINSARQEQMISSCKMKTAVLDTYNALEAAGASDALALTEALTPAFE